MITPEMISEGMDAGIVQIIDSPNDKEPACQIGESWFYFAGEAGAGRTADEYMAVTPRADVIRDIIDALNDIHDRIYKVEYLYYEAVLREKLPTVVSNQENSPVLKRFRITYHMRRGSEEVEACVTLPMQDYFAMDLIAHGISGYTYRGSLHGILTGLATIQEYIYAGFYGAVENAV